jgi:plastocyanin
MKKALAVSAMIVASIGVVACGGDDDEDDTGAATTPATTDGGAAGGGGGDAGGGQTLTVTADEGGSLEWAPTQLNATAGSVTIELDNPSSTPHNVEVEGGGVDEVSDTITESTASVTVDLQAGEYIYYCNVPGHQDAGMEGTLTVE